MVKVNLPQKQFIRSCLKQADVYCLVILLIALTILSCNKPGDASPAEPLPPAQIDSTKNTWECTIDGQIFMGNLDTSFLNLVFGVGTHDSVLVSTGTSHDRKSRIHFKLSLNRTVFPASGVNNASNTSLVFNEEPFNLYFAHLASTTSNINYTIDSFYQDYAVIRFSGQLRDQQSQNHTISGKFRGKLNKGSGEPNKFYCQLGTIKRHGYINSATHNANTLVMYGIDYFDYPLYPFKIIVRTGGTIKPGIYKAENGDVGFFSVTNSFFAEHCVVDDSLGAMTVNIQAVNGDIVTGTYSGVLENGNTIDSGYFKCRVGNYTPQPDAGNRWKFGAWVSPSFDLYNCFAGNVKNASRTFANGRNYLTINGDSDNGASAFKIMISSTGQILPGPYILNGFPDNVLDSIYFKSGKPTWNNQLIRMYAGHETINFGGMTTVYIENISATRVTGSFYGIIQSTMIDELSPGSGGEKILKKASFTADF